MDYDKTVALCALNKIFGYHPRLGLNLIGDDVLSLFSTPQEVPGHPELALQLTPASLEWAVKELARVKELGFRFLSILDEDYPPVLRECEDPPLGLYLNGSSSATEIFSLRPLVAFVGTRDMSPYGKVWCRKLVRALADSPIQPVIVSGLAFGVDAVAHRSALEFGLPTVGVMATGIDQVYPWQHERLAMDMVRTPGSGVVTDYPLDTAPVALNFLRRNRIIAGLSRAVVVVESKTRGGSLMTARYASEYDRDLYAVPGRLDDERSAGCNSLIREHMAEIITTPEDLAARLGLRPPHRRPGGSWAAGAKESSVAAGTGTGGAGERPDLLRAALRRCFGASSAAEAVALAVRSQRGARPEELAALTSRPIDEVLSAIGQLEAHGYLSTDLLQRSTLSPPWD